MIGSCCILRLFPAHRVFSSIWEFETDVAVSLDHWLALSGREIPGQESGVARQRVSLEGATGPSQESCFPVDGLGSRMRSRRSPGAASKANLAANPLSGDTTFPPGRLNFYTARANSLGTDTTLAAAQAASGVVLRDSQGPGRPRSGRIQPADPGPLR